MALEDDIEAERKEADRARWAGFVSLANSKYALREIRAAELDTIRMEFEFLCDVWLGEREGLESLLSVVATKPAIKPEIDIQKRRTSEAKGAFVTDIVRELVSGVFPINVVLNTLSGVIRGTFRLKNGLYNSILIAVERDLKLRLAEREIGIDDLKISSPQDVNGFVLRAIERAVPCIKQARLAEATERRIEVLVARLRG